MDNESILSQIRRHFLGRIKRLNKGTKRLLLVVGLVVSLWPFLYIKDFDLEEFVAMLIASALTFIVFWIIVRIISWIIDGYSENNIEILEEKEIKQTKKNGISTNANIIHPPDIEPEKPDKWGLYFFLIFMVIVIIIVILQNI